MPNLRKVSPDLVLAMLQDTKENGEPYNYTEIGERVGYTREYIRQLAKKWLGETGRGTRMPRIRGISKQEQFEQKPYPKGFAFIAMIRKWLAEIGHGYCCVCHDAVPIETMALNGKGHGPRCKPCMAAAARHANATDPKRKEYRKRYEKEHPEVGRRASRNYRKNHPEKARQFNRANAQRMKRRYHSDPEYRERMLAYNRARYHAQKQPSPTLESA